VIECGSRDMARLAHALKALGAMQLDRAGARIRFEMSVDIIHGSVASAIYRNGKGDIRIVGRGCECQSTAMTDQSQMKTVTAGVLLIGDELLSGRTQDTNLGAIAKFLAPMGVDVGEARILPDDAAVITETVRNFSERFDYVFTTGGIGPTHDDITADCIAAAFGVGIGEREDALEALRVRYSEGELNAARRRMARIPDGASLIDNPVSQAPGFQTGNVFTLAGVPQIMRGMLVDVATRIEGGAQMFQITVAAEGIGEGDAAMKLAEIEAAHPGVSIGSYPWFNDALRGVNFVARGRDEAQIFQVETALNVLVGELTT